MRLNCPQKDIWISLICAHLQDLIINAKSVENLSNQIYSVKKIKSDITWLVPHRCPTDRVLINELHVGQEG